MIEDGPTAEELQAAGPAGESGGFGGPSSSESGNSNNDDGKRAAYSSGGDVGGALYGEIERNWGIVYFLYNEFEELDDGIILLLDDRTWNWFEWIIY